MRAPFQILAIPYKFIEDKLMFCVLHRADYDQWQFISGGGEDDETPLQAAKREILEESGIIIDKIIELKSKSYIPSNIFPNKYLNNWLEDTYVIPEYAFGYECKNDIKLSNEHKHCIWLDYDAAYSKLKWDSNRTAMYELKCILSNQKIK